VRWAFVPITIAKRGRPTPATWDRREKSRRESASLRSSAEGREGEGRRRNEEGGEAAESLSWGPPEKG